MDLTKLAPHLAIFTLSFVTIAAFWDAQSRVFRMIENVSTRIARLYRAYFISLVLVSVTSLSLAGDPFAKLTLIIYTSLLLLTSIFHICLLYPALAIKPQEKVNPLAI